MCPLPLPPSSSLSQTSAFAPGLILPMMFTSQQTALDLNLCPCSPASGQSLDELQGLMLATYAPLPYLFKNLQVLAVQY